jgi:hypothetical protein
MARLPGVGRVVLAGQVPLYDYYNQHRVVIEGATAPQPGQEPTAASNRCEGAFFDLLGIPLLDGRTFAADVKASDPKVAIINQTTARRLWPGQNPVGRRLRFAESEDWLEVIGVVGDVKMAGRFDAPNSRLQVYLPVVQQLDNYLTALLAGAVKADAQDHPSAKPSPRSILTSRSINPAACARRSERWWRATIF